MAKEKSTGNPNMWEAFALEFIGGISYLAVIFTAHGILTSNTLSGLWDPILYAMAVIGAIVLFFSSFSNFGGFMELSSHGAMKASLATGFSLVALTFRGASTSSLFLVSLFGFVVSFIGSRIACGER